MGQSAAENAGAQPGGYETLSRQRMPLIPPRLAIKHLELHSKQLGAATERVYVGKHVGVTEVFVYATSTNTIINHAAHNAVFCGRFPCIF